MACDRKCFTITWRIENYNFYNATNKILTSASFVIYSVKDVIWNLQVIPESPMLKEHMDFNVQNRGTPINSRFDVNISVFIDDDNFPLFEKSFSSSNWILPSTFNCHIPHNQVYSEKENKFKPPETLIIRCKFYSIKSFSEAWQCFARTHIQVERTAFIGQVEKFGDIFPLQTRNIAIKSASAGKQLFSLDLTLAGGNGSKEDIWIEVNLINKGYKKFFVCKVFIMNCKGMKIECGKSEMLFKEKSEIWTFPLSITKNYLTREKSQFLSNDTLTLKFEFEFAFSTCFEYNRIEDSEFSNFTLVTDTSPKVPSALDELTCLYEEGILCDIQLQTATESFKAHKSILSARSSVFKSMFTTDMKEKITHCVTIEDLDADTVSHMLAFLYSDDLKNLDWKRAKNLYFASDKYNIVALKYRCSDFLKSNLKPPKCCDLLLLSDKHHDEELKKAVQEYIAEHHEEVLQTEQWMNLERNYPALTTETFRALYLRNWRN